MTAPTGFSDLDPAAWALAEARAHEEGVPVYQWIVQALFDQAAPRVVRAPHVFYGGGPELPLHFQTRPFTDSIYSLQLSGTTPVDPMLGVGLNPAGEGIGALEGSAIWILASFPPRIDHAAMLLSAAFAEADVRDFHPSGVRASKSRRPQAWYQSVVEACLVRSRDVRNALIHHWTPRGRSEQLWDSAFLTLCELSPARHELRVLLQRDRQKASVELARYLELATQQFELSANLLTEVDLRSPAPPSGDRFADMRKSLLDRAGGGVSLTEGAQMLGVTRQALHKRIRAHTALGMMDGDELVLPRLQWGPGGGKPAFVPGLSKVLPLFKEAGGWSALQFLLDPDPNLGSAPIDRLKAGETTAVIAAARANLGLDEE